MNQDDIQGFRDCIGAMFKTFGAEVTEAAFDGYLMGLADVPLDQLRRAVVRGIRESATLPRPYDLRRLAGFGDSAEELALAAWNDVQKALGYGPYKTVDFDDKLCNAVIRLMGGWPSFCSRFSGAEDEKWVRQEFFRVYRSMSGSGVSIEAIKPLPGISQAEVVDGKLSDPVPRRIPCDVVRAGKTIARVNGLHLGEVVRIAGEVNG